MNFVVCPIYQTLPLASQVFSGFQKIFYFEGNYQYMFLQYFAFSEINQSIYTIILELFSIVIIQVMKIINYAFWHYTLHIALSIFLIKISKSSFYGFERPSNFLVGRVQKSGTGLQQSGQITYPYTGYSLTTFINTPDAVVSLASIEWNQIIKYSLNVGAVNQSAVYINYTIGSKLSRMAVNILFFDTKFWQYTSAVFQHVDSSGGSGAGGEFDSISFQINNHQNYFISYLTGITAQCLASTATLSYARLLGSTQFQVSFDITYSPANLKIQYLRYFMMTFIAGYESPQHYRQSGCIPFGRVANALQFSSQNSELPTSATSSSNHFYGLHTIRLFSNNGVSSNIVNITGLNVQNTNYLFTNYRVQIRCCVVTSPYYQKTTGTCVSNCLEGYFVNQIFYCTLCDLKCKSCQGTATFCTSCQANFTYNASSHDCICPGLYNSSSGTCTDCRDSISNCIQCINETYCSKCDDSFFLVQNLDTGKCQCPSNYIYNIDGTDFCVISSQIQSCKSGQIVQENRCVCPSGKTLIDFQCL